MDLLNRIVVVTGGASGIGAALARRFAREGAAAVVVVDLDADALAAMVDDLGDVGKAITADVSVEADIRRVVTDTEAQFGRVDLFCSNAGIGGGGGIDAPDEVWKRTLAVNLLAHVYAARAVLPGMLERGEGYLLQTASAAGLLTQIENAPYTVSKHGAVALAEWLAITYGDRGIKVSCLCPQGVRTGMLTAAAAAGRDPSASAVLASGGLLEPDDVADAVVAGLAEERFLILPHPEVAEYRRRKVDQPDRWLAGMRRLRARVLEAQGRQ